MKAIKEKEFGHRNDGNAQKETSTTPKGYEQIDHAELNILPQSVFSWDRF